MAGGHGGPRTPAHPAQVSGVGKYSKRTDGGPAEQHQKMMAAPDQPYGAATAQINQQRVQPLPKASLPPAAQAATPQQPEAQQMPAYSGGAFNAPTARPGEHVMTGVDQGPGAGSSVLFNPAMASASQPGTGQMTDLLSKYAATDASGVIGQLLQAARTHNV